METEAVNRQRPCVTLLTSVFGLLYLAVKEATGGLRSLWAWYWQLTSFFPLNLQNICRRCFWSFGTDNKWILCFLHAPFMRKLHIAVRTFCCSTVFFEQKIASSLNEEILKNFLCWFFCAPFFRKRAYAVQCTHLSYLHIAISQIVADHIEVLSCSRYSSAAILRSCIGQGYSWSYFIFSPKILVPLFTASHSVVESDMQYLYMYAQPRTNLLSTRNSYVFVISFLFLQRFPRSPQLFLVFQLASESASEAFVSLIHFYIYSK